MSNPATLVFLLTCIALASPTCVHPQISSRTYITEDLSVLTHVAYIAELTVTCANQDAHPPALYAYFKGMLTPLPTVKPFLYQFSLNEEIKELSSGDITVHIYDEQGFSTIRKALRNNEDVADVEEVHSLTLVAPRPQKAMWISCEFLAVTVSFVVAYFAFSFRSKLLA